MNANPHERSLLIRLQLYLARARFFTFSLLVHVLIVVLGGSVVLFSSHVDPPDFVAGDGALLMADATPVPPAQPEEPQITMERETAAPQTPVSMLSEIVTTAPAAFAMPIASIPKADGGQLTAAMEKGLADRLARAGMGGGVKGGSTRMLGQKEKLTNAFVGYFYDLKQTRSRKPTGVTPDQYHKIFRRYIAENWKESIFAEYFRAKDPIYATQVFTPNIPADDGPKSFGLEKEVQPSRWLVHYHAQVSPPEDGVYHFVGAGDDVMLVRFNGKLILDRCWYQEDEQLPPEQNYEYGWSGIPHGFGKGSAVQAKAGRYYDMDVLIGEQPGGYSYAALLVEQEGAAYQKDKKGNPILPVFRFVDAPLAEPGPGQTYAPHAPDGPVWKAMSGGAAGSESGFDQAFGKKG